MRQKLYKGISNKILFGFIVLMLIFIVSCGGSIDIYTYTSDLITVADSDQIMYVTANITIDGLDQQQDIDFLRENLNSFSNERIVNGDYSNSLSFNIKIPIISDKYKGNNDFSKDLLYINAKTDESKYNFSCNYNSDLIEKINNYVQDTHYQKVDFNDYSIKITIDNDSKDTKSLTAYSVYVYGNPYPFEYKINLARRDKTEIELSEVLRKSIINGESYSLFTIDK